MGNDEIVIANDEILSMGNFHIEEILESDGSEPVKVEDPYKQGEYAEYEKEEFKYIIQLLDAYYEEIEKALEIIKEKKSKKLDANEEKVICELVSKIIAKHISQWGLGGKVDREKTEYLSATCERKARTDKEFCFVLIEVLKRFGFQVGNEQDKSVSLGYLGFEDTFNINRDFYVVVVKIDDEWYAINRNGFITETTIEYDDGMRSRVKTAQNKISYLCAKFNKGEAIISEGLQQATVTSGDFTYPMPIKISFVPKKEKGKLYNLTNVRVVIKSEEQEEKDEEQEVARTKGDQAQRAELKRQKAVEREYNFTQGIIKSNEKTIKMHSRALKYIEGLESPIATIDAQIEMLENRKKAMVYGSTYSINDTIQRLQERKHELEERLPSTPKEFHQAEIQRLEQENARLAGTITEHQDEVTAWREARAARRNERLSTFVKKVTTVKLPRPSFGRKGNVEREDVDVDIDEYGG